jgi:hypothetical protein
MTLAAVLLAPPVLVLLLFVWLVLAENATYWDFRRQAESYIPQIENFKLQHGFYPDPRTQTIVPETGPVGYASDGEDYCVSFSIWMDPTYNYCSQTQKWADGVGTVFDWPTGPWPSGAPSKK